MKCVLVPRLCLGKNFERLCLSSILSLAEPLVKGFPARRLGTSQKIYNFLYFQQESPPLLSDISHLTGKKVVIRIACN
jgi:hypothetical protein